MWTKRSVFFLVLFFGASGASAFSQSVFVNSGVVYSDAMSLPTRNDKQSVAQAGARFWFTDLFQLQGVLTYEGLVAAEVGLVIKPISPIGNLDPYAFVNFGMYLNGDTERSVVPAGVGATYFLGDQWGVNVELAGRWTLNNLPDRRDELIFGVLPTVGLTYVLDWTRRPPPEIPPTAQAQPAQEEEPTGEQSNPPARADRPRFDPSGDAPAQADRPERFEPTGDSPSQAERTRFEPTGDAPPQAQRGRYNVPAQPGSAYQADTTEIDYHDMVRVPDGTYIMGLADEDPLSLQTAGFKRVTVSSFFVDRYEVTNEAYREFLSDFPEAERQDLMPDSSVWSRTGNRFGWSEYFRGQAFADYPVVAVSYDQAVAYCQNFDKRLPTEAEWEYAARSGRIGGIYPWGGLDPRDDAGNYLANFNPGRGGYAADGYAFTAPVNAFPPTPWGLFNMSGNVAEWTQDAYNPSYSVLSDFNPLYQDPDEPARVIRGGSWASDAFYIELGIRDSHPKDEASPYIGFRCVQDVSAGER